MNKAQAEREIRAQTAGRLCADIAKYEALAAQYRSLVESIAPMANPAYVACAEEHARTAAALVLELAKVLDEPTKKRVRR